MITEPVAPESFPQRVMADEKKAVIAVEEAVRRALAGVERWYADHFHRAATSGSPLIPADQKAALSSAVASAVASKE